LAKDRRNNVHPAHGFVLGVLVGVAVVAVAARISATRGIAHKIVGA